MFTKRFNSSYKTPDTTALTSQRNECPAFLISRPRRRPVLDRPPCLALSSSWSPNAVLASRIPTTFPGSGGCSSSLRDWSNGLVAGSSSFTTPTLSPRANRHPVDACYPRPCIPVVQQCSGIFKTSGKSSSSFAIAPSAAARTIEARVVPRTPFVYAYATIRLRRASQSGESRT
jgi:hypothetical protein